MAVFDGLVNWWGWGDAAEALVDYGSFAAATATSVPFADHIAAYGLPAHDGHYGMGAVTYSPSNEFNGQAEAVTGAGWSCQADGFGIEQLIPTAGYLHPLIDPQVGHWGNNLGIVPIPADPGLWFDPREGWTFAIYAANYGGYYIKRASTVVRQYLVGDHLITGFSNRGWYIVADMTTQALVPTDSTEDGLATLVDTIYTGAGAYKLVFNNGGAAFSMPFGPTSSDYSLLVFTYDGVTLRTYNLSVSEEPIAERPTTTGEIAGGGSAFAWGARYNLGSDDNGFTGPWNGKWDETLQWNRALSTDEIVHQLPKACDAHIKIKSRFYARNAEGNNRFKRAHRIRGASGQSVPRDPAGHSTETHEPKGANLKRGLHQTMWFKWTAPASGSYTFHTGEGHPADLYSSAPLEVTPTDANEPDQVPKPGFSTGGPNVSGTYSSPPPGGSVFPPYPRYVGSSLHMFTETGDDWLERNPDMRIPGAARTLIDWPSGEWVQITFPYTINGFRAPSFGSDTTYVTLGRNPAYLGVVPQEDPQYLGPDHTDNTGPAATFPHWFSDVVPATGHVWDTGWADPDYLDTLPHISMDGGASFDTPEAGLWQLEFGVKFPSTNPQGDTAADQNHPYADIIGINYPHWTNKVFKARLRETVTDTVIAYHEKQGWGMQLDSGAFDVSGGMPIGLSDKDFSYIPITVGRVPEGRNFVVEVWQNTGTTLHTEVKGDVWMAHIVDTGPYVYPVLP